MGYTSVLGTCSAEVQLKGCEMLEPYAVKVARTVLGRGGRVIVSSLVYNTEIV